MSSRSDLDMLRRSHAASGSGQAAIPLPRPKWRSRVVLPGAILLSAAALLGYGAREAMRPALHVQAVPVVLQAAEGTTRGASGAVAVQAPGWIEADPFAINIAALAGGVVREVLVLEGDAVEAGQVVAHLVDDDARLSLGRAKAELEEKRADLQAARADLEAAKREWEHPVERERGVAVAKASVKETRAELAMLEHQIATESARAQEIREEYERLARVRESHAVGEADVARWAQRLLAQEGVHEAARSRRDVLEAVLERQEAELVAAREGLRLRIPERRALDLAQAAVQRAEAAVARARAAEEDAALRLSRMEIISPVSGVVLSRLIQPGSRLMLESDSMDAAVAMRVYDPARLQVRVDIPLADAQLIFSGQEAQIVTEALPNRTFRGRVSRIVHEANIQKNTVEVKVSVLDAEDGDTGLKPEMLARVRFMGGSAQPASQEAASAAEGHIMLIPRAALVAAQGSTAQVWVVDQNRLAAVRRDVRTAGSADGEWVQVIDGVRPGDRILVEHPAALREGARVRIVEAAGTGGASWR